jgi:hypothetical protein
MSEGLTLPYYVQQKPFLEVFEQNLFVKESSIFLQLHIQPSR